MEEISGIYRASVVGGCLRQGEILSGLKQFLLTLDSIVGEPIGDYFEHPYALLVTQDCDLEQDYRDRIAGVDGSFKMLPGLLFCEVVDAEELFSRMDRNKGLWRRVAQNKDERYHYLQNVDAAIDAELIGMPELGIDFKRYFTLPTAEVYRRIELGEARRRSVLMSPYVEHVSCRFAYYLSRIALPSDHVSE